jgi:predicted dehydrogenase
MPDHLTEPDVWLVGAGRMGIAYAKVLADLDLSARVIGRGEASAAACREATGLDVETGGLEAWLERTDRTPAAAIVAVDVDHLAASTLALLRRGVRRVLVEKPAGVDAAEVAAIASLATERNAEVFVAYNRRFYASTRSARAMIEADGGVTSFTFEFTELSDVVATSDFAPRVKANWFFANSTHVVDLAFFLGGPPGSIVARSAGNLPWHPAAARFAGAGETAAGALFTYHADWDAPGRWGVEIMTRRRRVILRPMEQLQVQERGRFEIEPVPLDDRLDHDFKPGLHRQVQAFLGGDGAADLLGVHDQHTKMVELYTTMVAGGERRWPT